MLSRAPKKEKKKKETGIIEGDIIENRGRVNRQKD
jgi:hypothetical protein